MKIGIITLAGHNFGCQLQNFAVVKAYESLGHTAVTIPDKTKKGIRVTNSDRSKLSKLKPSYIAAVIRVRTKQKFLIKNQRDGLLGSIIRKKRFAAKYKQAKLRRSEAFDNFYKNNIPHTDFALNVENIPYDSLKDFDFFSTGSDQVWNPTYPENSGVKFLSFTSAHKKLTFAPSFGISQLPEYTKKPYAKWLSDFNLIGVREQRGAEIIKELTGKDAFVMCDPTLTITRSQWEQVEQKPDFDTSKPYALTYFLGNEKNKYRRYIDKVAQKRGLRVINLFDIRDYEFYHADPAQFVYLIHHADCVFTDSFHCAVFSIIFKKDFVVFDRIEDGRSMGSRLHTLLQTFSLEDRMFDKMQKCEFTSPDFSQTDGIIDTQRRKTLDFLQKSIETNLKG